MKSAYLVLGVSLRSTTEEIRTAYLHKLKIAKLQEKTTGELALAARHAELRVAYDILSHREKREAHDLGLAEVGQEQRAAPPLRRTPGRAIGPQDAAPTWPRWLALVAVVAVAGGVWIDQLRTERVRIQAAAEAAAKQHALDEEQARNRRAQEEETARQVEQRAEQRKTDFQERQARQETERFGMRVQAMESQRNAWENQRIAMEMQEARRAEAEARMDEQRRAAEARRVVERDKQLIRELCMQNYRRPNC